MQSVTRSTLIIVLAWTLSSVSFAQDQEHSVTSETSHEIVPLRDFHEVIYPLWHDAWPNKNYDLIKEMLPKVRHYMMQIEQAELPGIYRDKVTKYRDGVAALRASTDAYNAAVEKGDEPGMLNAVEQLHSNYEKLVRVLRPVMKELEEYHVVLYGIYHHSLPEKKLAELRTASVELAAKSKILVAAEPPKRIADKAKEFKQAVAKLDAATIKLRKTATKSNWKAITAAVEKVHSDYQAVEKMFE